MTNPIFIHWFRQDLRLSDNPSLSAAAASGDILPIYILDDENAGRHRMGGSSRWWLHKSLTALNETLDGNLCILKGNPIELLPIFAAKVGATGVYWNRCYEPWRIIRDKSVKSILNDRGIKVLSFNGSLLWEPWEILKNDGSPYRVFTPFYRKGCLNAKNPRLPVPKPVKLSLVDVKNYTKDYKSGVATKISDLKLVPEVGWSEKLDPYWNIGEDGAYTRLSDFVGSGIIDYKEGRNFPARKSVSRLSTHLHWGEISPNTVWYAIRKQVGSENGCINSDHFLSELGWREFSYSLLYHFPSLPRVNLQPKFNDFPWQDNPGLLICWQKGMTGYPIIDAGMRELWATGYMHNRLRMIVGSFLVKNLLIHWHYGEMWFWDTLVDADLANNSSGWQWVAGCGADAAPYFRVFNPVTQSKRFDGEGLYIRTYVPELCRLPDKYLFAPWEAPSSVLTKAGIALGEHYPKPICDLKVSRQAALDSFACIKQSQ